MGWTSKELSSLVAYPTSQYRCRTRVASKVKRNMIAIEAVNTMATGCLGSVKVGGREISAHCLEDVGITRSKMA